MSLNDREFSLTENYMKESTTRIINGNQYAESERFGVRLYLLHLSVDALSLSDIRMFVISV